MKNEEIVAKINEAEYSLISVTWKGTPVFVRVRELSDLQIQAIGSLSLIDVDRLPVSPDWKNFAGIADTQHKILKAALVSPSYRECFEIIGKPDFAKEAEQEFMLIEKMILEMPKGPQRKEYETRSAALRLLFDFVLPNDFSAQIVEYVLGGKRTDIKLVTEEILWNCAVLQKKSGGRPSDYCTGNLSDFNKRDIDISAYNVYARRTEKK